MGRCNSPGSRGYERAGGNQRHNSQPDRGKEPQERKGMASEYQGVLRWVVSVDMRIARIFTGGYSSQGAVKDQNRTKYLTKHARLDTGKPWRLPKNRKNPPEGPASLIVNAVFQRPLSHYGSGRNSDKLKPSAPMDYLQKPDGTNISKAVEDVMNGIFWKDDTQVTAICFRSWAEPGYQEGLYITLKNKLFEGCITA
jgi:hypothetical protein